MAGFRSEGEYLAHLSHHALMPDGFSVRTSSLDYDPTEKPGTPARMNIACVTADEPIRSFAGVFTQNRLPGAPVLVTKRRMTGGSVRGVLINNKVANVGVGSGVADAEAAAAALARAIGARQEEILVASTGVIGWRLPVQKMVGCIEEMFAQPASAAGPANDARPAAPGSADALALARAIMTTDAYPKLTSTEVDGGRIVGVAKGAGMIEPHMATMLSFVFTDIAVDGEHLRKTLAAAVAESFNAITVDGDQSTSDMVLVLSSARRTCSERGAFDEALSGICQRLAKDVVRNGEGVSHLLEITVRGATDSDTARELARSVANSPLVKTAVYGNDPNVGRLVMAVGDFCGRTGLDPIGLTIAIGGTVVYRDGEFHLDGPTEDALAGYLRSASIDPTIKGYPQSDAVVAVEIGLDAGSGSGQVWGADLSYEYVRENADYRT